MRHSHSVKHRCGRIHAHRLANDSVKVGETHESIIVELAMVVLAGLSDFSAKLLLYLWVLSKDIEEVAHSARRRLMPGDDEGAHMR